MTQTEKFEVFIKELEDYIANNETNYKLGDSRGNGSRRGRWIWVCDKKKDFNREDRHYEFRLENGFISIELHFEGKMSKSIENYYCKLIKVTPPDSLIWDKWQNKPKRRITHKDKIDINDEDCVKKSIQALDYLFQYTHPDSDYVKGLVEKTNETKSTQNKKIPLNQILFGAPGTGKTYNTKRIAVEIINGEESTKREKINEEYKKLVEAKQIVFTTFHQSLSYEDFIEGIKPKTTEAGNVIYEIKDGIFKELCKSAKNDESKNYVLIIDEINRGNVSSIFGELITLIEEDKRDGNKEKIEAKLPYSQENFSVPNNLFIIGTMNTADRSVEALDTALRRRFSFIEMQANPKVIGTKCGDVDLEKLLSTINQRIEVLIDKDHQIGHSYFIGIQNLEDLKQVFKDKIIPLLEEYFYGDFGKIGLVLGGEFIKQEVEKTIFPKNFEYENDFLEDKKVYRFTQSDDWNQEAFESIYSN